MVELHPLAPIAAWLVWARPAAAWSLALPALLLLAALARRRPERRTTGALALWALVAERASGGVRRLPRPPACVWAAALALGLGALAWMGPRRPGAPRDPRVWEVVVDHSPSMGLALAQGSSRVAAAATRAAAWLAGRAGERDRVRWSSDVRPALVLPPGELPEEAWLEPPPWAVDAPRWALRDRPGVVWVTDRAPSEAPVHAALFASGGPAVAGPIGLDGRRLLLWDGAGGIALGEEIPLRHATHDGQLPEPLLRLLTVWAQARGMGLAPGPRSDAALTLRGPPVSPVPLASDGTPAPVVEAGRDGWLGRGTAPGGGLAAGGASRPWLRAPEGSLLVAWRPGEVRVGWSSLEEPAGDPAPFAVSWGELLDTACLPPAAVVPLAERGAAGEAVERVPSAAELAASADRHGGPGGPGGPGGGGRGSDVDAWLAVGAALAALLSLALGLLPPRA